jgi:hypothetical protein
MRFGIVMNTDQPKNIARRFRVVKVGWNVKRR